jgi:hypothetical protein
MPTDVLTLRALNRALLARQMLLRPAPLPVGPGRAEAVIAMVEHLCGLQAQAPFPPYYGLWSRLAGFEPGDLAELLVSRQVVRIALMRSTIHLVSARDCLALRPLIQPVLDRALPAIFRDRFAGLDTAALAAAGRALVDAEPRTFSELGGLLAPDWPGHSPNALAQGVRVLVPLVQVPPRAVWGSAGQARHTSAQAWLGRSLDPGPPPEVLITRYLGAFGPATVADVQTWSGLTRLAEVVNRLRPGLRTFRDEQGRELFDLPEAPRPGPDAPAPVRLVAEFDNLILSHADRTRMVSSGNRPRLSSLNGIFPGTVLVDGFVAGMWRLTRSRRSAVLAVELFGPVSPGDRDAIAAEGARLLGFAAAGGDHELRFAPLA